MANHIPQRSLTIIQTLSSCLKASRSSSSTIKAFASAREDTALDLSKPTGIACNAPSTIVTFALTKRVNGFGFGKSFAK